MIMGSTSAAVVETNSHSINSRRSADKDSSPAFGVRAAATAAAASELTNDFPSVMAPPLFQPMLLPDSTTMMTNTTTMMAPICPSLTPVFPPAVPAASAFAAGPTWGASGVTQPTWDDAGAELPASWGVSATSASSASTSW